MSTELAVATEAARAGGRVLRQLQDGRDLEIAKKDGKRTSIVTQADLRSHQEIIGLLTSAFPEHAVVGEEGSAGVRDAELAWYVDALDGTSNYAHGFPHYCVSIALCSRDEILVGVVYDVPNDQLFAAELSRGARRQGRRIAVSQTAGLRDSLLGTQVQSDDDVMLNRYAQRVRRFVEVARAHRAVGAPALALAYVACGWLDAFCEPRMAPWDTLAGTLLVEEAGGQVTTFSGEKRPLSSPADILASNGRLHGRLVELLDPEVAGEVPSDLQSMTSIE